MKDKVNSIILFSEGKLASDFLWDFALKPDVFKFVFFGWFAQEIMFAKLFEEKTGSWVAMLVEFQQPVINVPL